MSITVFFHFVKVNIFIRIIRDVFSCTVDQRSGKWQSKNTTIFVGTIIYQIHVSALIGHLQVGIQRLGKINRDISCPEPNLVAYRNRTV